MRPTDWFTPAEFRLALLLFLLAALGLLFRGGESLSPEVAAWLSTLEPEGTASSDSSTVPDGGARGWERAREVTPLPVSGVDPNTADEASLTGLPGIGPALAGRVIAARAEGPFHTAEDLLRVRGIGPATLDRLRPFLVPGEWTPTTGDTAATGDTASVGEKPHP